MVHSTSREARHKFQRMLKYARLMAGVQPERVQKFKHKRDSDGVDVIFRASSDKQRSTSR